MIYKAKTDSEATNLDERGAAEEETKHVRHDVITDHTGNWHDEPIQTQTEFVQESHFRLSENTLYETTYMCLQR